VHSTFFQLGPLRLSSLGVCAAIGMMAALALSQKTARYARLDPNAVWNAGMTAVVAAFVISRALLIAFNWHSFLEYPLLVMALPSLTATGVLLTGLFLLAYLRWRRLPLLVFLDAMAPCAALLWVFVSAGRFVEGTRDGMPWGESGGPPGKVHPVELYSLAAAAMICIALLRALKVQKRAGRTAGLGFFLAGFALYFIDLFRLPSELLANAWIEPVQVMAIAMIAAGAALMVRREAKMQRAAEQTAAGSEGQDAV